MQHSEPHLYAGTFLWISCDTELWTPYTDIDFKLPIRSSIVNKSVIGCCRCSFVCKILSEALAIQWTVWFWPAIAIAALVAICFAQEFRITLFDVSNIDGKQLLSFKVFICWKPYGICCSWVKASSESWWAVYQYLFSHFHYMVGSTIKPFCFCFFEHFEYCYY